MGVKRLFRSRLRTISTNLFDEDKNEKIKTTRKIISKSKKTKFIIIYIAYLLILSAIGFAIYNYFTGNIKIGLTIENLFEPDYKNIEGNVIQKTNNSDLPYILNPNTSKTYENINYSINSDGFRGREYSIEKNGSRIIFLGDSFTFGVGLPIEQTFPYILEKKLQEKHAKDNWEVLNLGVIGFNTKWEIEFLETKGLKYSPDIVILMYYLNDPDSPIENVSFARWGNELALEVQHLLENKLSGQEKLEVEEFLNQQNCYEKIQKLYNETSNFDVHFILHYIPLLWNPVVESLGRLHNLSQQYNFTVVIGIIPNADWEWVPYRYVKLHEFIRDEMKKHDFYVLDLYPILTQFPKEDIRLSKSDGHFSYFANIIAADALQNFLEEQNLI